MARSYCAARMVTEARPVRCLRPDARCGFSTPAIGFRRRAPTGVAASGRRYAARHYARRWLTSQAAQCACGGLFGMVGQGRVDAALELEQQREAQCKQQRGE